jgi:transcriptional regulator with XRE-family HTH domain
MNTDAAGMDEHDESPENGTNGPPGEEQSSERQILGGRLRTARETLGLTQDDVAGVLGIPRTSVIAMEAGRRNVTALELRRLARLYRRNVQWLLGEDDETATIDTALYRAANELSEDDRQQVLRFAQFLAAAGSPSSRSRRAAPAPFGSRPHGSSHQPES